MGGVRGDPGCMSRPRQFSIGVGCLMVGVLTRGVRGLIVWVPWGGWGVVMVTSGSGSCRGCCLGVLGTVLGYAVEGGGGGVKSSLRKFGGVICGAELPSSACMSGVDVGFWVGGGVGRFGACVGVGVAGVVARARGVVGDVSWGCAGVGVGSRGLICWSAFVAGAFLCSSRGGRFSAFGQVSRSVWWGDSYYYAFSCSCGPLWSSLLGHWIWRHAGACPFGSSVRGSRRWWQGCLSSGHYWAGRGYLWECG